MERDFKSNNNWTYSCKYHIVFCPKYRRKVLIPPIDERLKEIIQSVATEIRSEILEMEVMPDHVHILCEVDPQYGIAAFTRLVKGRSSRLLRQEFPKLKSRLPTLWTNSVFCSTVGGATAFHHQAVHRKSEKPLMYTLAIKYRLYPTHAQETKLRQTLAVCRQVYNSLVLWRKHDFEVEGKSPDYYAQKKALPVWKQAHDELCAVYSQVLQDVVKRVDLAFAAFFRRIRNGETPGYPRFKGAGQYDSLTYTQAGGFALQDEGLRLSKIGVVKAVVHRDLPGVAKTCTVRVQAGKWFACITCEVEACALPESREQIGIDVGLEHFAATSDGEFVANPRFFRKDEKALAKAQRKADKLKHARSQEQMARRRKANKVVLRIHERIRNRRHDFVHQTARKLVNRFGLIAVENLNVTGMVQNHCLAKSIADAAWSLFRSVLTQKAASAARVVIAVNPAYTSQDCSECGHRQPKKLSERVHACSCCGLVLQRDVNAAKNILKIGVGLHTVPA